MKHDRLPDPPVSAIMTREVACVAPDADLTRLCTLFVECGAACAPVVDAAGRALGMITKTDVLAAGAATDATAAELMTPFVFALPPEAPMSRAASLMAYEGVSQLVIIAGDRRVAGVVSSADIMRWLGERGHASLGPAHAGPHDARKRVMIIDDDFAIREDYAELLRDEGYAVVTAANGVEALAQLHASGPLSLILLDLRMPVMDGRSFHAVLRGDPALAGIPIVLLSGTAELRGEVGRMAVEGFLAKPATVGQLLGAVETHCRAA